MSHYKFLRTVITDEQLIEQYESELYHSNLSERELISDALQLYFEEEMMKV